MDNCLHADCSRVDVIVMSDILPLTRIEPLYVLLHNLHLQQDDLRAIIVHYFENCRRALLQA
jgi:hypothetical protein